MTPAERTALHAVLDGFINAGARIELLGWLFPYGDETIAAAVQAQAALDTFAAAVGDEDVEIIGNSISAAGERCEADLIFYPRHRPELQGMTTDQQIVYLRSHPAYVRRQPPHTPSSPAITYPPGRADRHYDHGNDAGIA